MERRRDLQVQADMERRRDLQVQAKTKDISTGPNDNLSFSTGPNDNFSTDNGGRSWRFKHKIHVTQRPPTLGKKTWKIIKFSLLG
jgi:hypothetical protein